MKPTTELIWEDKISFYDEQTNKGARILYHGDTGSGKTHQIGTAPSPFVIDCDRGGETLKALHIPHISIPWDQKGSMDLVRKVLLDLISGSHPEFKTVAIDSISSLSDIVMNELMRFPPNPRWGVKDPVADKPEYDHWGAHLNYMLGICQLLKEVSVERHVIVTATVHIRDDESMRRTRGLPEVRGSFREQIGKHFDYVIFLEDANGKYIAHTRQKGLFIAKSRGSLPAEIVDPTFDKVVLR